VRFQFVCVCVCVCARAHVCVCGACESMKASRNGLW
jgi:hypothetical protein